MAKVRVGGTVISKTIKIETVKPNRLKINLGFDGGFISNTNQSCELKSTWLHGAKAKNLKKRLKASPEAEKPALEARFKVLHSLSVKLNGMVLLVGVWLLWLSSTKTLV